MSFIHSYRSGFPGAQPVSMDRQNLRFLEQNPYKVSWKADGTRWVCCSLSDLVGVSWFLWLLYEARFRLHGLRNINKASLLLCSYWYGELNGFIPGATGPTGRLPGVEQEMLCRTFSFPSHLLRVCCSVQVWVFGQKQVLWGDGMS